MRTININFVKNRLVMGVPELRKELHDFINHADERFLKMVYAMSKEYEESEIVGVYFRWGTNDSASSYKKG